MSTETPQAGDEQKPTGPNKAGGPRLGKPSASIAGIVSIPVSLVLLVAAAVLLFLALSGEEHRTMIWTSLGLALLAVGALGMAVVRRRGQGAVGNPDAEVPDVRWPLPAGEPPPLAAPLAADAPAATGSTTAATAYPAPPEDQTPPPTLPGDPRDPADEPAIEAVLSPDGAPSADLSALDLAGLDRSAVAVVDGRPRFHLASCAFLAERQAVSIPLAEARASGFTPCAICRPIAALRAAAPTPQDPPPPGQPH